LEVRREGALALEAPEVEVTPEAKAGALALEAEEAGAFRVLGGGVVVRCSYCYYLYYAAGR
jgi:hypothetical protein